MAGAKILSGIKRDHGMIKMLWRMRLAKAKPKRKRRDVSQLKTDEQVHATNENAVAAQRRTQLPRQRDPGRGHSCVREDHGGIPDGRG